MVGPFHVWMRQVTLTHVMRSPSRAKALFTLTRLGLLDAWVTSSSDADISIVHEAPTVGAPPRGGLLGGLAGRS